MRLFLAVDISKPAQEALGAFQLEMQRQGLLKANYEPLKNLHITLRFIGEESRLGELTMAMHKGAFCIPPFTLQLGGYGVFGNNDKKIGCVKLKGDIQELDRLHENTEKALFEAGFGRDKRPLTPHITLARKLLPHDELYEQLNKLCPTNSFFVDHVTLYESVRGPDSRQLYRSLQVCRLQAAAKR